MLTRPTMNRGTMTRAKSPQTEAGTKAGAPDAWLVEHYHVETWGILFRTKKAADLAAERMRTVRLDGQVVVWGCSLGRCAPNGSS